MERVARLFPSFEDADETDRQDYERVSPRQRVEMLLRLRRSMVKEGDESAERLERILTVVERPRR
jgi:hypothetical protein